MPKRPEGFERGYGRDLQSALSLALEEATFQLRKGEYDLFDRAMARANEIIALLREEQAA